MRNANNNSLKSKDEISGYQNKNVLSVKPYQCRLIYRYTQTTADRRETTYRFIIIIIIN